MIWKRLFPSGGSVEISLASQPHAPGCAAIHAGSFARGWSAFEFESLFSDAGVIAHVAAKARSSSVSGFSLCRVAADEAEILSIAVAPAARRAGLGARLLLAQIEALRRMPVRRLFLEVDESNAAARALYARHGFAEAGRRKGYYPGPGPAHADALILRCAL